MTPRATPHSLEVLSHEKPYLSTISAGSPDRWHRGRGTIKQNAEYIAHYHTGGVPGRHEIDETQEINYPAVMKAIVETGYKGFVGQEFVPSGPDPLASLRRCVAICDV